MQVGLETKKGHWKHASWIGNKKRTLETCELVWKQKKDIGNMQVGLETENHTFETHKKDSKHEV